MELNDRKKLILKAIIANYLETGEPVGSRTISKHPDLKLSSATIRNEMADLEDMGFILQPHTSAGRIPSDAGYRFYVDQLMMERETDHEEKQALIQKVDKMEVLLKQVANVLASNTNYATMVSSPHYQNVTLKFVQLSQVDHRHLLAVIVTQGNIVKNKMISVEEPLSNEDVLKLNVLLNTFLQGLSLRDINLELIQTMRDQAGIRQDVLERILEEVAKTIHEADRMEIYTGGASNILRYPELGNPDRATEILDTLVEKKALTKLVDTTLGQDDNHHGIQVYIGEESPVQNMKDCSIVTATYELAEGGTGTVGIIGPKRMDYRKVVKTLKDLTEELDDIFREKT
ncbi:MULTISPECIES: heat-inducible transcriptional repressor HrcA [Anaerostipes]|uniref:heat-inducible transcriptional repressor HrcA n=1 Tax=Anaerostipes TaxID=207244 RepID=UPI0009512433|nr:MULTISPECIES: heat-inducible transcriptional repressor HrcA [Anaerostipes]MCI5623078.1 heat-inducible transcriptional repressor HrcA [Anaerostipes sp.]MDY2726749.1 heat-inducible transcriptional repressor HrcA [Anaerostipes faecalis]OLR58316.1 heat-inducible transcription repressor HrcA [Anaerostipes sp. 494a]